jgi:hypothetical protein
MEKLRIRYDVISWNNRFPLDRWWRKKYNVSYLSTVHREFTFYGMYFEFYEEKMFEERQRELEKEDQEYKYVPMSGNWWIGKKLSNKEIDDWFNTPL